MNIKNYIQNEYKSWIIAVLIFLVFLFFGKSFEYIKSITELNLFFKIVNIILIFAFGLSFIFYSIFASGLQENIELGFREYEIEDVERLQRSLNKMLAIFSITSIIWIIGNLIIGIKYGNSENLKYFAGIIVIPMILNGILIYIKNKIKTAYNNGYK